MRTKELVIQDLFGANPQNFTIKEVLVLMEAYAQQFRYITTTCGKRVLCDEGDYHLLREYNLFWGTKQKTVQTVFYLDGKKKVGQVARFLFGLEGSKEVIHYKNGDTLDIRRDNLEIISFAKSHYKQRIQQTEKTSQYKGVSWSKFAKKWCAYIMLGAAHFESETQGKKVRVRKKHLGYFLNEEDAASAYNEAAIQFFGKEYCLLNEFNT